jgi:DASH complex subunit DAM1
VFKLLSLIVLLIDSEEDARAAIEALQRSQMPPSPLRSTSVISSVPDASMLDKTTYTDVESDVDATTANADSSAPKGILKKKGKVKLTNKEKKERAMEVEHIVSALPLEFRGSDPSLRKHIELVIEGFLDRLGKGVPSKHEVLLQLRRFPYVILQSSTL